MKSPVYEATRPTYLDETLYFEGQYFRFDGEPNDALEGVNLAAKLKVWRRRAQKWLMLDVEMGPLARIGFVWRSQIVGALRTRRLLARMSGSILPRMPETFEPAYRDRHKVWYDLEYMNEQVESNG